MCDSLTASQGCVILCLCRKLRNREPKKNPTPHGPYAIWVSEIMLPKTNNRTQEFLLQNQTSKFSTHCHASTLNMLDTIRTAWGWTGIVPTEVVFANPFGNLIVKAVDGAYWRICPEALTCEKIAGDQIAFSMVWNHDGFRLDWNMDKLVLIARQKFDALQDGRCYCFKLSPILGGAYDANNISTITVKELIAFSGFLAEKIKDVPDGGKIKIELIP